MPDPSPIGLNQLKNRRIGHLFPSLNTHLGIPDISSDNYSFIPILFQPFSGLFGICLSDTANTSIISSRFKHTTHILIGFHPSSKIYGQTGMFTNRFKHSPIDNSRRFRPIQIDQMQPIQSGLFKQACHF